jgi:hypothetical protein
MDGTVLGIFAVMKIIKLALSYGALAIATNYTSQIYTEKVYVRQENPPNLVNMLFLFIGIELLMTIVTMSAVAFMLMSSSKFDANVIGKVALAFSQDYVLYMISMLIHGAVVANIMYTKKYFLYKDDGLRGIRAYSQILTQFSVFNGLIPFNMFVTGIMQTADDINKRQN